MQKKLLSILVITLIFLNLKFYSQKETQNWFFSTKAGLSFASNPPTSLLTGSINNVEGVASISDTSGALLFYTDGSTVYTKNHLVMANGTGLMGDFSSTQSALIIKKPASTNLYYVFTTDDSGTGGMNGLNYSIVDMSLAAGLGSVTTKNTNLYAPSCEKLSAVKHCNGNDVWILSHELTTNVFRNFLLTASGINTTPVLSAVGTTITNNAAIGQMKFSPNGKRLGLAIFDGNIPTQPNPPPNIGGFEVYDFDASTGILSNFIRLHSDFTAYGCEFSRDGTKFYGSVLVGDQMFQWNLCAGSGPAIVASEYTIVPTGTNNNFGSMQLALNGKIYIAQKQKQSLSVINSPDALGNACSYSYLTLSVGQRTTEMSLPNFMSSYFKEPSPAFTFSVAACKSASFTAGSVSSGTCGASNYSLNSTEWIFGDPLSGSTNTASGNNPFHTFSSAGSYTVKCIYKYQCSTDTVAIPLLLNGTVPSLSVAGTFTICKGDARSYTVSGANTYSWNTNSTASSVLLNPTVTTSYSVTGTNTLSGCQSTKVMTVSVKICTGVEEFQTVANAKIFPNPFEDQLSLETDKQITLRVFSQLGNLIKEEKLAADSHIINVSELAAGFYIIQLRSESETKSLRFVKTEK